MTEHKKQVPLAIHPDDAKDKVFAAILKALMKMGNTPSSPKELANTIVKHKYATLGGQTPFATVSSRISQHFKRAAQHNPPRAPLLTKHVDQHHSRKINYSLATDNNDNVTTKESSDSSELSSEEELMGDDDSSSSPIVKHSTTTTMPRSSNKVDPTKQQTQDNDDIAAAIAITKLSQVNKVKSSDDSDEEQHSDYFEEMMLEDNTNTNVAELSLSQSSSTKTPPQQKQDNSCKKPTSLSVVGENEYWAPFSFEQEFESAFLSSADHNASPESIPVFEFDTIVNTKCNVNTPPPSISPPPHHRADSVLPDVKIKGDQPRRSSWPNDSQLASSFTKGEEIKSGKKERFEVITSTLKGHTYKITKKWIDNMEFYELDSPDDIPDTKVLRFIASSDQHIALTKHRISNNDMTQLKQGYVNATQLRKAATPVLGEGEFDVEEEKKQNESVVVIRKESNSRGAWVPLERARELVEDFEIESSPGLTKLLSDNPLDDEVSPKQDYSLSRQASLDFSNQLTNTLMNEDNSKSTNESTKLPSIPNKELTESLFVRIEKKQSPPLIPAPSPISSTTPPPSSKVRKHAKIAPSTKHLSTSEILKSMNIQNLNLSALQHMMTAIPNLAQLSPQNLHFAKTLETYMNTTKATIASNSTAQPLAHAAPPPIQDLKSVLSRIPLLDALLLNTQKQAAPIPQKILPQPPTPTKPLFSDSNTTTTASSPSSISSPTPRSNEPIVIYPTTPTEPSMTITVIDNIAVCIAILKKQEGEEGQKQEKEYQVMRRLDNGFINGTQLLTAGGIETESERSMILSFEMSRVRMPNKKSGLFGTWIPSRRALELAATCSIQHTLGPFLDDDIELLFPSPLPDAIVSATKNRRKRSNSTTSSTSSHHLAAITLAALRNPPVDSAHVSRRGSIESPSSLNNQLLTHPNNTLKMVADSNTLQAPLLGSFLDTDGDRRVTVIDKSVASTNTAATTTTVSNEDKDNNSDVDIESEDAFMSDLVRLDDESSSEDENTDTDNDVEEVRKKMRKIRDAAIAAMEVGPPIQLDDIFQQNNTQPPPFFPHESKRRRKSSGSTGHRTKRKRKLKKRATTGDQSDNVADSLDEEEEENEDDVDEMDAIKSHFIQSQHPTPYKSFNYCRKKPTGGKWSASNVSENKMAPKAIKRSATWSSSMDRPIGSISKRQRQQNAKAIKEINSLSIAVNTSVTNATTMANTTAQKKDSSQTIKAQGKNSTTVSAILTTTKSKKRANSLITHTVVNEEDEDEDVDIGGSDNDDDLR